jgi:UDP-3-O-[3-hydroxymyristoyl] glucosamine N-acyltransferase
VLIGGQVGLAGHLKVGDRVKIAAQSGVPGDIKEDATVMGSPAFESNEYKKAYLGFRRLPMILDRLKRLEDQLKSKTKS